CEERALSTVRLKAASVLDGITSGYREPKISATAPTMARALSVNAQPNLSLRLNHAAPMRPTAASTSAPHVQAFSEEAVCSHHAQAAPTTTATTDAFLATGLARSSTAPEVLRDRKMAPWLRKSVSVTSPPSRAKGLSRLKKPPV